MYANDKAMAERWEKHTPKGKKLPEKVKKQTNKNAELKSGFKRNSMDVKTQEPSDIQKLAQAAAHRELAKLASLGGLQAAYVADAAGADASERANALAGDRAREEDSNLIDDLFGQTSDAQRMINKRKRHANAAFAESDVARLLNVVDPSKLITKDHDQTLTGLAMVSGKKNKDKEERVLDRYKEIIRKYQEPVDMDGKRTSRETPFHLQSQGDLADRDMDIAGHTQQRKEHPINYWLNPLDRTGPINEIIDRWSRRSNAATAAPDSAIGRLAMGVGNVGTLGLLGALLGGEDAQNKLRRSAVDNRIFDEHSMPRKVKDDDKKSEKEKKAGVLGAGAGAALGAALQKRRNHPLLQIPGASFKSPIMDYLHKNLPMGSPLAGAALGGLTGHVGEEGLKGLANLFSGDSEEDKRKALAQRVAMLEGEKAGSEKQANLANIIKALKAFGKRTLAPAAGTGLVSYGIGKHKGYGQGFESGQDSIKNMSLKEIMDLAMPQLEVAKQASAIQELAKEAGNLETLEDNIHTLGNTVGRADLAVSTLPLRSSLLFNLVHDAKRKRDEKPAKKGDKDHSDAKKEASAIQELAKEAGKRGLWDNIHAKRKRGEKPAKKGDKDYPDEKSWKKTTKASK